MFEAIRDVYHSGPSVALWSVCLSMLNVDHHVEPSQMQWHMHIIPAFGRLRQRTSRVTWIPVTARLKGRRKKGDWKDGSVVVTLVLDLIPPSGFCRHLYIHYAHEYPLKIKTHRSGRL